MARSYPIKKGIKLSTGKIEEILKQYTKDVSSDGKQVVATLPGMSKFVATLDGSGVTVETVSDLNFKEPQLSVRIFNEVLEKLTGYSAKERKKFFSKL